MDAVSAQKRVLIVEDEAPIARALALKLHHSGFQTVIAGDGEQALDILARDTFGLIVLDLVMPKQDGFTVLERLRERENKTPILIWSNLGQRQDIARARTLGASDYLVKSQTPLVDVVARIKQLIEGGT
ncbi:MAG: response regulator [Patescibacteria group bacterium]